MGQSQNNQFAKLAVQSPLDRAAAKLLFILPETTRRTPQISEILHSEELMSQNYLCEMFGPEFSTQNSSADQLTFIPRVFGWENCDGKKNLNNLFPQKLGILFSHVISKENTWENQDLTSPHVISLEGSAQVQKRSCREDEALLFSQVLSVEVGSVLSSTLKPLEVPYNPEYSLI